MSSRPTRLHLQFSQCYAGSCNIVWQLIQIANNTVVRPSVVMPMARLICPLHTAAQSAVLSEPEVLQPQRTAGNRRCTAKTANERIDRNQNVNLPQDNHSAVTAVRPVKKYFPNRSERRLEPHRCEMSIILQRAEHASTFPIKRV